MMHEPKAHKPRTWWDLSEEELAESEARIRAATASMLRTPHPIGMIDGCPSNVLADIRMAVSRCQMRRALASDEPFNGAGRKPKIAPSAKG